MQKPFERGVALLHSFWYEEAEKEFTQIATDDPHCAMAHWGIAMSLWHQLWNKPDAKVIQHGLDEVHEAKATDGPTTPREKAYIAAIAAFYSDSKKLNHDARAKAYSDAMKKVYETYPDDHEAAVFYALSLLASEPHDDATFANRKQAAAILEKLFATEPDHPGVAHYLIHAYDKPQLAQLGLPAARRYAQIAPAAPHALHMPSHIFARVGLWQDDINSNLASIAATRKTAAMGMGGEGHQFHAMDFLFYAYMQSGRDADAQSADRRNPRHAQQERRYVRQGIRSAPGGPGAFHRALSRSKCTTGPSGSNAASSSKSRARRKSRSIYWARAIGSAHLRKPDDVRKDLAAIENLHKKLVAEKSEFAERVEDDRKEAASLAGLRRRQRRRCRRSLRPIADKEDAARRRTGRHPRPRNDRRYAARGQASRSRRSPNIRPT